MLSIIVPVRDESKTIKEVFDYFNNNLNNINYEVLIINDFSNDDTLNITKSLIYEYKNFKVLDNNKKGLGGAINLGIKKAMGENIAIMMADIINDLEYDEINYDVIVCKIQSNDYPFQN